MEGRPGKSGRTDEFRKGADLKGEVMTSLKNKYDIVEEGCLSIAALLKNKNQAGTVKIKHFIEKNFTAQTKPSF